LNFDHPPVFDMIVERLPATIELMGASFLFAAVIALVIGGVGGLKPAPGRIGWVPAFRFGLAMPIFWFGLILQLVFSVRSWVAAGGGDPRIGADS
jgi:peptide/nickel transport system permease protein